MKLLILLLFSASCFSQDVTLLNSLNVGTYGVPKATGDSAIAAMNTKSAVVFSQTSSVSITGITESTLKGTLFGTDTIRAASATNGKTWVADVSGSYTNPSITIGGLAAKVYLGSTVILTGSITSLPINITTLPYVSHVQMVCRGSGSGANIAASGYIEFNAGTGYTAIKLIFLPTVTAINFSTDKVYNPTITFSSTGNTLTSITHTLTNLN